MDLDRMQALLSMLAEHEVSEFQYKDESHSIKLRIGPPPAPVSAMPAMQAMPAMPAAAPAAAAQSAAAPAPAADSGASDADSGLVVVESPMVGTYYSAPAPDADPYVQVGSSVGKGNVLCIVEAMKLMNEIEAEVAGTIAEVLVENGTPVQFGQALFKIRPN